MSEVVRRKLIEVALPLEAINIASAREKSIRHGHPSTLHLWWARRPLAACRAVLFASLVDDPSSDPERFPTEKAQEEERQRLFRILEDLVRWDNSANEEVLTRAKAEIMRSTHGNPPAVIDPFCGGGSIPLEAQRLGLTAYASDLNPVAVLITKALVEIPPRFAARPPINPDAHVDLGVTGSWVGARGLAEDVRYYGGWMREEAERRIGRLYPRIALPEEHGGGEATVIAWIWARTVTCPNPACRAEMPLVRSFELSTRKGAEAWVVPIVDRSRKSIRYEIAGPPGQPPTPSKTSRGANFRCLVCEQISPDEHIKSEGRAGRMSSQMIAIVATKGHGRLYLPPDESHVLIAASAKPDWAPDQEIANDPRALWTIGYGLTRFKDLFTARQLVALTTFSDLVSEVGTQVHRDAIAAGLPDDDLPLDAGGSGARAYADAVATYLAFAVDRVVDRQSTIATWDSSPTKLQLRNTFARQAIPMTWDFGEGNPFSDSSGTFAASIDWVAEVVDFVPASVPGFVAQADASSLSHSPSQGVLVSTDPPYYDNIGYADLSDFFYVWLRRSLSHIYPDLFGTVLTPKSAELVATPYRFDGSKARADRHFEAGLRAAFEMLGDVSNSSLPVTIYYAFKQAEGGSGADGALASTGWETMLSGLLGSGLAIDGTWPIRSELGNRMIASGTNALASSIVIVARPRRADAGLTSRKDFIAALKRELPESLRTLQHGNIAPVDLAQASIGPGMSVFSRYTTVLEPDGTPMSVRTALAIINQALAELLAEQEGELDADTRWAIAWYEQFGFGDGPYGQAEVLSKAKDIGIDGLARAGIVEAARGKVHLVARDAYRHNWEPASMARVSVWEITQRVIHALSVEGEEPASLLLARVGGLADSARTLAYQLYGIAEKRGWSDEGQAYNSMVVAWPTLLVQAEQAAAESPQQSVIEFA